ncbi:MAG: SDR family NAD(P)-dependent oxidoreductase, partial [Pseudomonadota bacterium]
MSRNVFARPAIEMAEHKNKSFLVLGAGAGIGGQTAKRFATEGYHAVLCRRSNAEGLTRLVQEIENMGGTAEGRLLNLAESEAIESLVVDLEQSAPPIDTVLYNLGAQIGTR